MQMDSSNAQFNEKIKEIRREIRHLINTEKKYELEEYFSIYE